VSQPEIAKKSKNLFWRSRSFKVIEFGASREPVYDFLLAINSNLGPISHSYWDTATYWPEIANFATPLSLSAFVGVTPFEFMGKLYGSWNSLSSSRRWRFGDSSLHRFWLIHPCDRRTDRRTDRIAMAKTRWKQ